MKNKFTLFALFVLLAISLVGCIGESDPNDGKCDICGKKSTYSDGREEYCDKHLEKAANWYIEQGQE